MFKQWTDNILISSADWQLRHELSYRSWTFGMGVLTIRIRYGCHLGLLYGANLAVWKHDE